MEIHRVDTVRLSKLARLLPCSFAADQVVQTGGTLNVCVYLLW